MIREGIEKIREAYPERESTWDLLQKSKRLWPKIRQELTFEERAELLDLQNSKPLKVYIEKLEELVKKYRQDRAQIQMFKPRDDDGKK